MIDAPTATILGALVGAASGITGGLITVWLQLRLERAKWPKAREDALVQDLREAIQQLTVRMASALHSMCWLTWIAEERVTRVTAERIKSYDDDLHKLLPEIMGFLSTVAALDKDAYTRLSPIADKIYEVDYEIGKASLLFEESPAEGGKALVKCYRMASALERQLPKRIADIVSERVEQRAKLLVGK